MFKLSKADRQFIEEHRGRYRPDLRWYVTMTHWGRERLVYKRVEKEFGKNGVEELLLPELMGSGPQDKLLFGGHLFFRCRMTEEIYMGVCSDPWVFKIFGRAFRIPEVISEDEMRIFKGMLGSEPRPRLVSKSHIGAMANVIDGLMKGMQGRVVGVSAQFVVLETQFSFLDQGDSIVVSVPHEQVCMDS